MEKNCGTFSRKKKPSNNEKAQSEAQNEAQLTDKYKKKPIIYFTVRYNGNSIKKKRYVVPFEILNPKFKTPAIPAQKSKLSVRSGEGSCQNGEGNVQKNGKQKPNKINLNLKSSSSSSDSDSSRPPLLKRRLRAISQPHIDESNFEFYLKSMSEPSIKSNQQSLLSGEQIQRNSQNQIQSKFASGFPFPSTSSYGHAMNLNNNPCDGFSTPKNFLKPVPSKKHLNMSLQLIESSGETAENVSNDMNESFDFGQFISEIKVHSTQRESNMENSDD